LVGKLTFDWLISGGHHGTARNEWATLKKTGSGGTRPAKKEGKFRPVEGKKFCLAQQ